MNLYFITGNKSKFEEVTAVLPEVKQLDLDLPEIQSLDSLEVIAEKLKVAMKSQEGEFIVEDNSLVLNGMNGLPGPLIKWFLKSIGNEGLLKLANTFGKEAEAKVIIGYASGNGNVEYFEGVVKGTIVEPRGNKGFGWDPIFLPAGEIKTYGEMELEEKNRFSSRRIAVEKLKKYLVSNT